tara:strand:+ start:65 stop:238 length:174 start_codon:yes stop_codon:yes gene_type:complete
MGGVMGEESRQSRGLVCSYCGVKGAGLANEFIDLPEKGRKGRCCKVRSQKNPDFRHL